MSPFGVCVSESMDGEMAGHASFLGLHARESLIPATRRR